ncbi:uncharacterized protein EHS24_009157 [Apiotrichum porosum]|uniref:LITAF domain-containing protein n=1 Tax=Apiotrichum porosum TaxID=105984 RepID=A0A427XNU5_9TREE|nr:uncharacterized protein EHS24_009157 [Apiotrichum porosum]RSH80575.1 hypothetical protein EHS24_009157 [Apiotrichum porosum]
MTPAVADSTPRLPTAAESLVPDSPNRLTRMRQSPVACVLIATTVTAVVGASSRTWFELCWIPLIPFSKKHIWLCTVCRWQMKKGDGYDPQVPQQGMATQQAAAYPPPPPPNAYGNQASAYGNQYANNPPPPKQ